MQSPLLSNDLAGFAKILVLLVTVVLLPIAALVIYFLKRGPDGAIQSFRTDFNGLGTRLSSAETHLTTLEERMAGIYSSIADSQRDVLDAIRASSEAQIRAVHLVEIEVARLQERANIGDCLQTFGQSIQSMAEALNRRTP